jgi:hypothetical protein
VCAALLRCLIKFIEEIVNQGIRPIGVLPSIHRQRNKQILRFRSVFTTVYISREWCCTEYIFQIILIKRVKKSHIVEFSCLVFDMKHSSNYDEITITIRTGTIENSVFKASYPITTPPCVDNNNNIQIFSNHHLHSSQSIRKLTCSCFYFTSFLFMYINLICTYHINAFTLTTKPHHFKNTNYHYQSIVKSSRFPKSHTPSPQFKMIDDPNQYIMSLSNVVATSKFAIIDYNIFHHLLSSYMYYLETYGLFTQACTAAFFAGLGDVIAQSISIQQSHIQQRLVQSNNNDDYDTNENRLVNNDVIRESVDDRIIDVVVDDSDTVRSYSIQRTIHYILKGLGSGCMWSVWFYYSDPISLEITDRFLQMLYVPNSEIGYASMTGDIGIATAASYTLSKQLPSILSLSGSALQHMIHVFLCIVLEQFIVSPLFFTLWDIPIPALLSGSPLRQIPAQIRAKLIPLLIANAKVWTPANIITYNLPSDYRVLFAGMTDFVWQAILSEITSNEITIQPPLALPKPELSSLSSPLPKSLFVQEQQLNPSTISTTTVEDKSSSTTTSITNRNIESATTISQPTLESVVSMAATTTTTLPSGMVTSTSLFQSSNTGQE